MDEVHFLADRMRGAVWEEVILHLPDEVRLVSLSATVSNAEEFGGWIQTVRGDTTVVVDEHRPVPLWQHVTGRQAIVRPVRLPGHPGDEGRPRTSRRPGVVAPHRASPRSRPADRLAAARPRPGGRPSMYRPPSRPDVIGMLDREGLLPAITFIFSRAGCDAAVKQCLRSSLRLTTDEERGRIAEVVDRRCGRPARLRSGRPRLSTSGARVCCAGWRPTTPECCRSSATPWRSCSPPVWSRPYSPRRHWRWESTCPRARWCWSGWSNSTVSSTCR